MYELRGSHLFLESQSSVAMAEEPLETLANPGPTIRWVKRQLFLVSTCRLDLVTSQKPQARHIIPQDCLPLERRRQRSTFSCAVLWRNIIPSFVGSTGL